MKLSEVLKYYLRKVRAYLHREEFQRFWEYSSAWWARKFLDECVLVHREMEKLVS